MTMDRIRPLVNTEDLFVVTNREYRELIREQLPEVPEENILFEPAAKNTAPCIGWAATAIRERYGDAVMIVLPSDHLVQQPRLFQNALKKAVRTAEKTDGLVTLGIAPSSPETGYGYIRYDTGEEDRGDEYFRVKQFVEKPDLETAQQYLRSGEYLWNSGMFIWKASAILKAVHNQLPELYSLLEAIGEAAGTGEEQTVLEKAFSQMKPVSIDRGVLEKAENIYVLPSSFGWDDVGSWLAVERYNPGDAQGNVIRGDAVAVNSNRCLVQTGNKVIALVGMEDTIIVDTKDALLVCAKDSAEDIRKVLDIFRQTKRTELL
jgi:mannose-1-phosphate guanylyltransferase